MKTLKRREHIEKVVRMMIDWYKALYAKHMLDNAKHEKEKREVL